MTISYKLLRSRILKTTSRTTGIRYQWCPGHVKIPDNEGAHNLPRKATELGRGIEPTPFLRFWSPKSLSPAQALDSLLFWALKKKQQLSEWSVTRTKLKQRGRLVFDCLTAGKPSIHALWQTIEISGRPQSNLGGTPAFPTPRSPLYLQPTRLLRGVASTPSHELGRQHPKGFVICRN